MSFRIHTGWWERRGAGCSSSWSCSVSVWGHRTQPDRNLGAQFLQAHRPWALQHSTGLRPESFESVWGQDGGSWGLRIWQWVLDTGVSISLHCPSRPCSDIRGLLRTRSPKNTPHWKGPEGEVRFSNQKWRWRMDTVSVRYLTLHLLKIELITLVKCISSVVFQIYD